MTADKPDRAKIVDALQAVQWDGRGIIASGVVASVSLAGGDPGKVNVILQVGAQDRARLDALQSEVERAVRAVAGVQSVVVGFTAHQDKAPPVARTSHVPEKKPVPGVRHIVVVASGKGGVGKSTTAVNLALALAGRGLRVGLLDADIYGPSVPRMLGLAGQPAVNADKKMVPFEAFGIACMSMGFLVGEDQAMVWRGPMVHAAITQLFRDVAWGERDVLVVDMPPGTGDAHLTLAQSVPVAGAVIVSTPQDIALLDARKAVTMFGKVDVPLLGLIENMSYFECPKCGERTDLFGHGGAMAEAARLGIPYLGGVPLHLDIRVAGDAGTPVAANTGSLAETYREIAAKVAALLR